MLSRTPFIILVTASSLYFLESSIDSLIATTLGVFVKVSSYIPIERIALSTLFNLSIVQSTRYLLASSSIFLLLSNTPFTSSVTN